MAKNYEINVLYFFDKRDLSFMSRAAITPKFIILHHSGTVFYTKSVAIGLK